jgi:subtilisin family serine protease
MKRVFRIGRRRVVLALAALALAVPVGAAGALSSVDADARPDGRDRASRPSADLQAAPGKQHGTEAFPKLDPRLAALARGQDVVGRSLLGLRTAGTGLAREGSRVRVVIEASDPAAARDAVRRLGGQVERSVGGLVQALVAPGVLPELSGLPAVERVRAPYQRVAESVTGEELEASGAPGWHTRGLTGKGVKVAVIDGGFAGYTSRQASGDLPSNVVTRDFCGGDLLEEQHGTAVAEIVHEMAPDAELYLLCIDTEVDLAAAAAFAQAQGVRVISHSASWFGPERGDGTGLIGGIVAEARAAGILWVNSAGNYADAHWSGTYTSTDGDRWHEWGQHDEGNSVLVPDGAVICGFLRWDEWPAGISDFDLALHVESVNQMLSVSEEWQTGTQPAVEGGCVLNDSGIDQMVGWAIYGWDVKSTPRIDFFGMVGPPLEHHVAAGSIADPASSPAALAVGALCWQTNLLEPYSSQGPTIDGRTKPDLAGHDSFSTATYGAGGECGEAGFAGTSASAPQVAGAAALVQGRYPDHGPDEVQAYLEEHAIDLGAPGKDDLHGAGQLSLSDREPPEARAVATRGKAGRVVKLLAKVFDDFGEVRIREQVFRGSKVIATLRTEFLAVESTRTVEVAWKPKAGVTGRLKHCVQATDRAGNVSPVTCAAVILT